MKRIALLATLLGGSLLAPNASAQVFVGFQFGAPPPRPVYVRPMMPAPGYVWCEGGYGWRGQRWAYSPGYWAQPPRPRAVWVPAYWKPHKHKGYRYHPGYWR
jgi:hypothetical protein